jgi:hypothetical protein
MRTVRHDVPHRDVLLLPAFVSPQHDRARVATVADTPGLLVNACKGWPG